MNRTDKFACGDDTLERREMLVRLLEVTSVH